jgi:hypothetical protein
VAEFDDLFRASLRGQQRLSSARPRWRPDPAAESAARELTRRELECCCFFTFTFATVDGMVELDIEVPPAYVGVLDALGSRAGAGTPGCRSGCTGGGGCVCGT